MRRGFTLIELLVSISILAVLMGLLLAVSWPWLRERAKTAATTHRLQQIQLGIESARLGGRDVVGEAFARATGHPLQLAPLREVLTSLIRVHGLQLDNSSHWLLLPPSLASRHRVQPNTALWPIPSDTLEGRILFFERQLVHTRNDTAAQVPQPYERVVRAGLCRYLVDWYGDIPSNVGDIKNLTARAGYVSRCGETLDRTLEVMPDGRWPTSEYLARWPGLWETGSGSGDAWTATQTSWPASDWDNDPPGTVPTIWPWPWGRGIISRYHAKQITQVDAHRLGELNPLLGAFWLQMAGVIAADADGIASYRDNRSAAMPWNDRWGNPLVVAYALQMAPRLDYHPDDLVYNPPINANVPRETWQMPGGRDFFVLRAREAYGFHRCAYIAAGASGAVPADLPTAWPASEDARIQRRLWLQVRDLTRASEWTEASFASPPWQGVRQVRGAEGPAFLGAPVEIR